MKKSNIIRNTALMTAFLSSFITIGPAFSQTPSVKVLDDERPQDKGWFMYNEGDMVVVPENSSTNKKPPEKTEENIFTTKWFKENLPKYHSQAVDNPTDRNILAHEILQRIMLERSYRYARRTVEVYQKYPALDGNTYSSGTNAGFSISRVQAEDETIRIFQRLKNRLGLWFFFDDSRLSKEQEKTMKMFRSLYPIEILPISVNGAILKSFPNASKDQGHAKELGLNYFPAVLLVDADTKNFYPVTFNHIPLGGLTQKILQIARTENMISDVEWEKAITGGRINPFMEMVYVLQSGDKDIKDVDDLVDHFIEIGKMGHGKK